MTDGEILIIEDDRKTAELVRLYLERAGFAVQVAHDGLEGLTLAQAAAPDAIVLDLMLPGMDGLDICHNLRETTTGPGVPILMLTARSTEDDLILGLEVGADDYLTKPFSPRELVARVRALVRRNTAGDENLAKVGDLVLDLDAHEVRLAGELIDVTPVEFRLLATLVREPGRAFSRQELLDRVFGLTYDGLPRTIDVHVLRLRRKLEPDPQTPLYLQTVYGHGYRLNGELAPRPIDEPSEEAVHVA
ncbi:MAG: response regulator transcription factor [Chloroflexota bacterium]